MNNNYNSVYLTLEERVLVDKFRDLLDARDIDYNEEKYNNNYLIRFLNLVKAFSKSYFSATLLEHFNLL